MGECVICKKEYYGYGHNAAPVEDGKCCDRCNEFVISRGEWVRKQVLLKYYTNE